MSQLKKKFIENNAVDETKIRLSNNANLKARNAADSADINIAKVNASDRIEFASVPQVTSDAVSANDLVRKSQLDALLQGLKPKEAANAVATANVDIATELEAGQVVDGVTLEAGDRILLIGQTDPIENGIYVSPASGAASRSLDMDLSAEFPRSYLLITAGTVNAGKGYVCNVEEDFVLGTDPATFIQFSSAGAVVGGDMITVSGSTVSVDLAAAAGLESTNPGNAAGQLRVKVEASDPSLQISSNELGVKFSATTSGLEKGASGLAVNTEASNPTLEVNGSGELKVKFANGLEQTASGLEVDLDAAGALEFNSGDIRINVDATNGTTKVNASNELESVKKEEEQITLGAGDITNQYIDLTQTVRSATCVSLAVEGGIQQERGVDYTVSVAGGAGGVTRITFDGDLETGGDAALISGDKVFISYEYL
jgi:hypothetical protein